jgi:threonine dehydrogenase-like Zn-dependent dehydrogenase
VILEIKASGMCGSDLHNYRAPAAPAVSRRATNPCFFLFTKLENLILNHGG